MSAWEADLDAFLPDGKNANKHTARGAAMLEHSLRQYGAGRSILVDKNGRVIAGNQTQETAIDLGMTRAIVVPTDGKDLVIVQRTDIDLDSEAGRGLALADNRTAQVGIELDGPVIAQYAAEYHVDMTPYFYESELPALFGEKGKQEAGSSDLASKAEQWLEKWKVGPGQLWEAGGHRILCGDTTKGEDLARLLGHEKIDVMFTDPPYTVAQNSRNYARDVRRTYEELASAAWDKDFNFQAFGQAVEPYLADDLTAYVFASQFTVADIWAWVSEWAKFTSYCVWCKPNPIPSLSKRHWTWATELIVYAVRGKHTVNFPKEGNALNWWTLNTGPHEHDHPTEKPVELALHALEFSSRPGAIVFDGFCGSGSTLVACQQLGRVGRAIEKEPLYVATTIERLSQAGLEPVLVK